ncbi:LysE family translocator [Neptunomonas japonica]|uniref:Threonine/lysine efflux protein n=1 Tax=Neptunomonas japonica JAMM 1380 TaxID=1441457 RepID=A0A7R6SWW1_9GAMM|nr:LysE family translocator [Neptunomonas japonica]BBB31109.1 threonine/lysine efflux protein [Neptunomonas japonica JAMM 1380]
MAAVVLSMIVFALVGAISPGPVNIIATGAGANFGFVKALPHVLGATVAYALIVFLVGVGLNEVLLRFPQITDILQYIGGAFLLYMSFKIATASPVDIDIASQIIPPRFIEGALAQGLNPKAWLVSMSGVSLFVSAQHLAFFYLLVFCLVSFCMCLLGVGTWAVLGHFIGKYLSDDRHQVMFNRIMGVLLSSTVVTMFLQG